MDTTDPLPISPDKLSKLQSALSENSYAALIAYISSETARDRNHRSRFTATVDTSHTEADEDVIIDDLAAVEANEFIVEKVINHHELNDQTMLYSVVYS